MKTILLFFFNFVIILNTFSQNESNVWMFGSKAGVDFNTNPPTAIPSSINTEEGCSSISGADGALLFYSDGVTVWNRNNQIMLNGTGLMGSNSTTQSALIVRQPGSNNIYYIFTLAQLAGPNGFRYSTVDMSLDNTMGAIVNKNVFVAGNMCEKITAIQHQNEIDIWLVTHELGNDVFQSYLLNNSGLSSSVISSSIGTVLPSIPAMNSLGYMKSSSDGKKIAMVNSTLQNIDVLNFDNSTGVIDSPITLDLSDLLMPYGVEFSPNSKLIYVTDATLFVWTTNYYQFNLEAGTPIDIFNSKTLIGTLIAQGGPLQLGPDKKIYFTNGTEKSLGVINKPDEIGVACNLDSNGIRLWYGEAMWGLPNVLNTISMNPIKDITIDYKCLNDTTLFTFSSIYYDSILWNFGDQSSGSLNYSNLENSSHIYTDTGQYQVSVIVYSDIAPDTVFRDVYIKPLPSFNLGNDTILCTNDSKLLNISIEDATFLWQDGSTDSTFNVSNEGTYWVNVTKDACYSSDTINLKYSGIPDINILKKDTTLCYEDQLTLNTYSSYDDISYLWQDGSVLDSLVVFNENTYEVSVSNVCGINSDKVFIGFRECRCELLLADAFTPNNDGLNETFFPVLKYGNAKITSFHIYNRWGVLVHSEVKPWNGKVKNIEQESDYYNYFISYSCENEAITISGALTIIK